MCERRYMGFYVDGRTTGSQRSASAKPQVDTRGFARHWHKDCPFGQPAFRLESMSNRATHHERVRIDSCSLQGCSARIGRTRLAGMDRIARQRGGDGRTVYRYQCPRLRSPFQTASRGASVGDGVEIGNARPARLAGAARPTALQTNLHGSSARTGVEAGGWT